MQHIRRQQQRASTPTRSRRWYHQAGHVPAHSAQAGRAAPEASESTFGRSAMQNARVQVESGVSMEWRREGPKKWACLLHSNSLPNVSQQLNGCADDAATGSGSGRKSRHLVPRRDHLAKPIALFRAAIGLALRPSAAAAVGPAGPLWQPTSTVGALQAATSATGESLLNVTDGSVLRLCKRGV